MQSVEKAYIAGFIDGDGVIGIYKEWSKKAKKYYYYPRMQICNRNKANLEWINKSCGNRGTWYFRRLQDAHPMWCNAWQLKFSPTNTIKILKEIEPYLIQKKEQAQLVIYRQADEEAYQLSRRLNKTGPQYNDKYRVNSGKGH